MEKKYVVPEGMLEAVDYAISKARGVGRDLIAGQVRDITLESALRWLAENPITPTKEQSMKIELDWPTRLSPISRINFAVEWQRRMFLAPEPDELDVLKKSFERVLDENLFISFEIREKTKKAFDRAIEEVRRGQKSAGK